ncbi:MAG: B12-binding domain-containing radical SAM protein [Eubacterium sp.]|nr:B12-binding domain-containing radical SAM protein [Eubacterium sp.]
MKFLLCGINAKYIHSNLAIFCLRAYARAYGSTDAEYIIKEYTINHYTEDILMDLYLTGADVVVFSCYIWNISYVRELAAELKKVCPATSIWVGGPEVSYDAKAFLENNPSIDLVMQGEGEEQFTALVGLWEKAGRELFLSRKRSPATGILPNQEIMDVVAGSDLLPPGLAMRSTGEEEGIIDTGFALPVDMDRIPFVYEDFQIFSHKIIYYESSRGCPFACSYCLSSVDKSVRFRSLSLVLPELGRFLEAGVPQVKFVDRTFNCNRQHAMAIWRYIYEHDNGVTNFHFEISADLIDEEALKLFEKMRPGLIQLEIGVQSTNPATIEAIHRRMDLKKLFENVDRIHSMGNIHQHLDLIAGLPHEGYQEFRTSFNDLYVHAPDQLQLGFLKVLKGTFMEKNRDRYRLAYRSMPPYEVLATRWMDYGDIIGLKGIEELVETYYNSMQYTWTLKYVLPFFRSPFDFYESFARWYGARDYHRYNHSRMEKYEMIRAFLLETPAAPHGRLLDEMLLLDMYLRENIKKRPSWAPDQTACHKDFKQMYRERGQTLFPKLWESDRYDSKKAAGQSHLEWFSFDVKEWMECGRIMKKERLCLFDYESRNPLNHNAGVRFISFRSDRKRAGELI